PAPLRGERAQRLAAGPLARAVQQRRSGGANGVPSSLLFQLHPPDIGRPDLQPQAPSHLIPSPNRSIRASAAPPASPPPAGSARSSAPTPRRRGPSRWAALPAIGPGRRTFPS